MRSTATAVKSTEADASVGASAALNHTPVLLQEVLQFFRGIQLRTFVDGTLGAGGHSAAIACHHSVGLCSQARSRKAQRSTGLAIHLFNHTNAALCSTEYSTLLHAAADAGTCWV